QFCAFQLSDWMNQPWTDEILTTLHKPRPRGAANSGSGRGLWAEPGKLQVVLALWEGPSAFGKGYPNFHKACQLMEAQSALKYPG
ncbi:hypothetical protein, partial [Nocardioides malaquae]|uniref:hypothetical protein n=1 Tax=Nocardioides malaquae TaxID=2773426 RepID=UPI001D0D6E0F